MKHLALALILATGTASAGTVFILPNNVGGGIYLTDAACDGHDDRRISYIKTNESKILAPGCWAYAADDDQVVVFYDDGTVYSYPAGKALVTPYGEKKLGIEKPADPVL